MARALSMKSLAKGLRVRFFTVTITTDNCRAGNSTGDTLSGRFLALKRINRLRKHSEEVPGG